MKTITIFGYGTLMNEESLKKTVPSATNLRPAITYGFRRFFNLESCNRYEEGIPVCVLNIEDWSPNSFINGICFDFSEEDFEALKKREKFYAVMPIKAECYHTKEEFDAYIFQAKECDCYDFLHTSRQQMEYVNICYDGAKKIDEKFLEMFRSTTYIKNKNLKDLEL